MLCNREIHGPHKDHRPALSPHPHEVKLPPTANDGRAKPERCSFTRAALKLMQQGKYAEAHIAFDKMLARSPGDLAERIRMLHQRLRPADHARATPTSPPTERALRLRHLSAQRRQLPGRPRALPYHSQAQRPTHDYAFYGLALLASMTGDSHQCRGQLARSHPPPMCRTASRPVPTPTSRTWPTTLASPSLLYPEA